MHFFVFSNYRLPQGPVGTLRTLEEGTLVSTLVVSHGILAGSGEAAELALIGSLSCYAAK